MGPRRARLASGRVFHVPRGDPARLPPDGAVHAGRGLAVPRLRSRGAGAAAPSRACPRRGGGGGHSPRPRFDVLEPDGRDRGMGASHCAHRVAAPRHRRGGAVGKGERAQRRRDSARRQHVLPRHPARLRLRHSRRAVDPLRLEGRLRAASRAEDADACRPGRARIPRRLHPRALRFSWAPLLRRAAFHLCDRLPKLRTGPHALRPNSCRWRASAALLKSLAEKGDRMHRDLFARLGAAALLLLGVAARGQSELDLFEADARLKQETSVASVRPATVRDSPGVLTLLSRDEILASGARDLLDVLQLVPGFSPGVDVEGVTDVGFRGVWGHEGKILLLLDGQEMNETLYSTLQLGHELPADQIQSIEIVRGPGSARYGGNAELAVINVKTRNAQDLIGGSASVVYGQTAHGYGHRGISLTPGKQFDSGVSASVSGYFGQGNRSDRSYDDLYGNQAATTGGHSRVVPAYLNVAVA